MQGAGDMRLHPTPLLVSFLLLSLASPAAAGSYISLGIGNQADTAGALDGARGSAPGRSGRVALGQRIGPLALEAGLFGTELPARLGYSGTALVSAAAEVKYHISLAGGLELYGKGGLNRGWVGMEGQGVVDTGSGYTIGSGLQFGISGPLGNAAIWLDYTFQAIELDSGGNSTLGMANLGLSAGI